MFVALQLVLGPSGVLQGIRPGKCYVEMSTVDPETITELSQVHVTHTHTHTQHIKVATILNCEQPYLKFTVVHIVSKLFTIRNIPKPQNEGCFSSVSVKCTKVDVIVGLA